MLPIAFDTIPVHLMLHGVKEEIYVRSPLVSGREPGWRSSAIKSVLRGGSSRSRYLRTLNSRQGRHLADRLGFYLYEAVPVEFRIDPLLV